MKYQIKHSKKKSLLKKGGNLPKFQNPSGSVVIKPETTLKPGTSITPAGIKTQTFGEAFAAARKAHLNGTGPDKFYWEDPTGKNSGWKGVKLAGEVSKPAKSYSPNQSSHNAEIEANSKSQSSKQMPNGIILEDVVNNAVQNIANTDWNKRVLPAHPDKPAIHNPATLESVGSAIGNAIHNNWNSRITPDPNKIVPTKHTPFTMEEWFRNRQDKNAKSNYPRTMDYR